MNLLPFPSEAVTGLERFTLFFPLWTLLAALLSLLQPDLFTWVAGPVIVWSLALIMLGMGLGLSPADFRRAMIPPRAALIGVGAQFLVMPALAASLAWALKLEPPLAVGLILVGCCPGGTASNVVALIARADVALSVVMTSLSTLLAVVVTPLLTSALAGRYVPVDGWTLLVNVLQVVLVPVTVGVAIKQGLPRLAARVQPVMPPLAVMVALRWRDWEGADNLPRWAWRTVIVSPLVAMLAIPFVYRFAFKIDDQQWIWVQAGAGLMAAVALSLLAKDWSPDKCVQTGIVLSLVNLFLLVGLMPMVESRFRSNQSLKELGGALVGEYRDTDEIAVFGRIPQGLPLYTWPIINQNNRPWFLGFVDEDLVKNIVQGFVDLVPRHILLC